MKWFLGLETLTLTLTLALTLSLSASAIPENPMIRTCVLTDGSFLSLKVNSDEVGFCLYEKSLIDSLSMLLSASGDGEREAVSSFWSSPASTCEALNSKEVQIQVSASQSMTVCAFADGSMISLQTLITGPDHPSTDLLARALQIRF